MTASVERSVNPLLVLRRAYSRKARAARAKIFQQLFPRLTTERVLDLGGGKGDHIASVLPGYRNVTIADYDADHLDQARQRHGYDCVRMDGSNTLTFKDGEFDVVYCNSVIEHVTGPLETMLTIRDKRRFEELSWTYQKAFAAEIRRIGKAYFVQTPYKWFLIESHTITPVFVQLFPRWLQLFCYRLVPKKRTLPDFNLLTIKQMRELFPDAEIILEKSMGMTKSIIAVKRG